MDVIDLLGYTFIRHAVITALLASIACGILGTYIVSRRLVLISGGITHASFGGIGMGYYFGFDPLLGAAVFSVLSALGIEWLSHKDVTRHDSSIAILWSFGMAIGIIFVYLTPGYSPNLLSYLFGNILTVSLGELKLLLLLTLLIALFFAAFFRTIVLVSFDEEFAKTRTIPVQLIKTLIMAMTALTIVMCIRVAGIILVLSLLTIPQATANIVYKRFRNIIFASIVIGFTGSIAGLTISYLMNIPSGASIIFVLVVIFLATKLFRELYHSLLIRRRTKTY